MATTSQIHPQILDNVNFDKVSQQMATALNVDTSILNTEDQIEEMRQARQQQEQLATTANSLQQGADIAKTASEASTEPGNALSNIMGGVQQKENEDGENPLAALVQGAAGRRRRKPFGRR